MKTLNMANQNLTELPKGIDYDEYETVHLYSNRLASIPENAFPNAKTVDFSHNQLTTIPESAFPNAERVYLADNQLASIPENAFPKAKIVDLVVNRLTSIPENAFPNAETVDLANNRLDNYMEKYQGYWDVYAWGYRIKIGCELHTIKEWENFTDDEIDIMDENALEFWKKYKSDVIGMAKGGKCD